MAAQAGAGPWGIRTQGAFAHAQPEPQKAPPSTKNRPRERDPKAPQTKQSNAWHVGMKAHSEADVESGLAHTVLTTPANAGNLTSVAHQLLHGEETIALDGSGYQGVERRAPKTDGELRCTRAQDITRI